ncbi:MAG TPA: tetratricopeptide repeat protein, partial [Acidimicrobiales bacterium]
MRIRHPFVGTYTTLIALTLAGGVAVAACSSPAAVPNPSGSGPAAVGSPNQLLNSGVAALKAGNTKSATADFNAILTTDPSNKYGDNKIADYDLGVIDQTQGDTNGAITNYQAAIKIDPNYTGAEYNLAIAETASNPTGAIALYRQVIAASPTDVNAIYNLGLLLYESGQKTEGDTYLNQAIQMAPSLAKKLPP